MPRRLDRQERRPSRGLAACVLAGGAAALAVVAVNGLRSGSLATVLIAGAIATLALTGAVALVRAGRS